MNDNATAVACPRNCLECDVNQEGEPECTSCKHADLEKDLNC